MNFSSNCAYICIFLMICSNYGCKKNIAGLNTSALSPTTFSFNAPYNQTWNAVVESVSAFNSIDSMEQKSGNISTDATTVAGSEITEIENAIGHPVYRFNYDVKLLATGAKETSVTINVKFFQETEREIYLKEQIDPEIESFFREHLYSQICQTLFPLADSKCSQVFKSHSTLTTSFSKEKSRKHLKFDKKVLIAQHKLNTQGYNAGSIDGLLGKNTRKALKDFQKKNSLPATGELDMPTYDLLVTQVSNTSQGVVQLQTEKTKIKTVAPAKEFVPAESVQRKKVVQPVQEVDQKNIQPALTEVHQQPLIEVDSMLPVNTIEESPSPGQRAGVLEATLTTDDAEVVLPLQQPQAEEIEKLVVSETAYLLENQDLFSAKILDIIPEGTRIVILAETGNYYKIQFNGVEGYIHTDFVDKQN